MQVEEQQLLQHSVCNLNTLVFVYIVMEGSSPLNEAISSGCG